MNLYHFDTDFLVWAVCARGPERDMAYQLLAGNAELQICSAAWYEFCRGPRRPEEIAVARCLFPEDGVIPLSEDIALRAADTFRSLGSPKRRAMDIVIGTTAAGLGAKLVTRNARDFADIPELRLVIPPG